MTFPLLRVKWFEVELYIWKGVIAMKKIDSLGFQLKKIDKLILRTLQSRMRTEGFDEVSIVHGYILGYLYHNADRTIYQRDIEKEFGITKSSVATILKLMEKKGYIERNTEENDGRFKKISLTDLGIQTHLSTVKIIQSIHKELEFGISEEEKKVFMSTLNKMEQNITRRI